jgi:hypothetical protein
MTYQEVLWKDKLVWVVGIKSKSGKLHRYVRKYVGRGGVVTREAKNGMLLVHFKGKLSRAIPAGCLELYEDANWSK